MQIITGVGVVVENQGKILLGHRISGPFSGSWCLPGGKLEPGEAIEDCARRELEEETGIRASGAIQVFSVSTEIDVDKDFHSITFGTSLRAFIGTPRTTEPTKFSEWRWVPLEGLPEELFQPTVSVLSAYWKFANLLLPGRPSCRGDTCAFVKMLRDSEHE